MLELPCRGGSNEYPQSMFWAEIWKISDFFIGKIFSFWRWIFLYIWTGVFWCNPNLTPRSAMYDLDLQCLLRLVRPNHNFDQIIIIIIIIIICLFCFVLSFHTNNPFMPAVPSKRHCQIVWLQIRRHRTSHIRVTGKQCRPSVFAINTLFAINSEISIKHG